MKVDKYDRQIRIWGPKGQKRLAESKVAIVGCSGAAIETAKNLILPGVGQIDILDDKVVQISDLSTSFFYTQDSVGKPKAQEASRNLLEMNPDVSGEFKNVSVEKIIESPSEHLKPYDLIICANLKEEENKKLSKICLQLKVSVIFVTSVGFFFHVRSQKEEHIIESENIAGKKYYLRLHDPFEGLKNYASEKNLMKIIDQLKQKDPHKVDEEAKELYKNFGKITYPIFLIEAYGLLKEISDHSPKSSEVKELLQEWRNLVPEDLDIRNGVNEALQRTFDLYQTTDNFLPDMCLFDISEQVNINENSEFIYIFLKAVTHFMSLHNNSLPQVVRLPDITTSTKDYIDLKNIYKHQHSLDKKELISIIGELVPGYKIDEELLSEYINNIDALKIIRIKPYYEELENPDVMTSCMEYLDGVKQMFITMRSYKLFEQENNRPPQPGDFVKVFEMANTLASSYGLTQIDERFIKEICRYEGKTLISYDSMAGAVAGQEAVKLLTGCFELLNGGFYFDGLTAKGYTIRL